MTTRKFNYTGRQKLTRADFQVALVSLESGAYEFTLEADLSRYGFPPDAVLVAEAYEQSRFERFELGALAETTFPVRRTLDLFSVGEAVKFRIKIVGSGDLVGRLLGEADQVIPYETEGTAGSRVNLLRTEAADLGDKVWELSLIDYPILRVNNRIRDWRALLTSQEFAFMVYPQLLKDILEHVVLHERQTPDSDLSAWEQLWIRFASKQPGVPEFPATPGTDDVHLVDWIDAVIEGFARKNRLLKDAIEFCDGGTE